MTTKPATKLAWWECPLRLLRPLSSTFIWYTKVNDSPPTLNNLKRPLFNHFGKFGRPQVRSIDVTHQLDWGLAASAATTI